MKIHSACLFTLLLGSSSIFAQNEIDTVIARARNEMMRGDIQAAPDDFIAALKRAKSAHDSMREFLSDESLSQVSAKQNDPQQEAKWLLAGLGTLELLTETTS